ncbi:MAG TPA: sulfotransferase [Thiobacillaceae bacterium]|nr:sulfotransferase [Thiobacillaceae bacterium]
MSSTPSDTLQSALAHARSGNLAEAETLCLQLLAQPVVESEARHLLGVIRNIQGRYAEAEALLRQAVAEQPAVAKYRSNLGNALRGLERLDEAEVCYRQALTFDPGFVDARANLAKLLYATNRWDEAIAEYRQLIRNDPQDVESHASLSFLLESGNRLAEAEEVASAGLKLAPDNPTMNLAMAICERSAGKIAEAMGRLETLDAARMDTLQAANFHCERGLLYDRLDRIELAWVDFVEGNRLQAQSVHHGNVSKARYAAGLDRRAQLDVSWVHEFPATSGEPAAPVFLVGFPRSGTTLLDQILDSHPKVQTLEEKPVINRLCDDIDKLVGDAADCLKALAPDQLTRLRQLYFEYVADFIQLRPGNLLVDKLPLNITRVPYIMRVFPDARFILALRHPCDCVLSCYMHLFEPNDAMANFYTLEDTAALYARVMGLWRHWVEVLPLRHRRVYYEHLVHDLPGEIKPLLDFLGLEWREEMARPHEHAARRGHINTPSYSQVIQPIYRRAAGRWRRYLPYLSGVMSTLQPYIEYFGYEELGSDLG